MIAEYSREEKDHPLEEEPNREIQPEKIVESNNSQQIDDKPQFATPRKNQVQKFH